MWIIIGAAGDRSGIPTPPLNRDGERQLSCWIWVKSAVEDPSLIFETQRKSHRSFTFILRKMSIWPFLLQNRQFHAIVVESDDRKLNVFKVSRKLLQFSLLVY